MKMESAFTHTYLLSVFNWPLAPHESRALEGIGPLIQGANSLRFNNLRRLRADCQCEQSPLSRADVSRALDALHALPRAYFAALRAASNWPPAAFNWPQAAFNKPPSALAWPPDAFDSLHVQIFIETKRKFRARFS